MQDSILLNWPYFGLIFGVIGLIVLSFKSLNGKKGNWKELIFWWPLPIYMIHQFEEHGIDIFGNHYPFREYFCAVLGSPDLQACTLTPLFFFAVNVGTVWIAGLLSGFLGKRWPLLGVVMIAALFVNGLGHLMIMIIRGVYNPGVVTGSLLFIPFALISLRILLKKKVIRVNYLPVGFGLAGVLHLVLIGSAQMSQKGLIGQTVLAIIQFPNGFLPLLAIPITTKLKNRLN
jgi:hypothetical protein